MSEPMGEGKKCETCQYKAYGCSDPSGDCPQKRFFYDGQCYIFEREPNGNNQMICEVRGVGAGLEKRNAKLLEDSLNGHALLVAENAALKEALVDCWFQVEVENALINSIEKATGEKPKVFGRFR